MFRLNYFLMLQILLCSECLFITVEAKSKSIWKSFWKGVKELFSDDDVYPTPRVPPKPKVTQDSQSPNQITNNENVGSQRSIDSTQTTTRRINNTNTASPNTNRNVSPSRKQKPRDTKTNGSTKTRGSPRLKYENLPPAPKPVFDNEKYQAKLKQLRRTIGTPDNKHRFNIKVNRKTVLPDSYAAINPVKDTKELKKWLRVKFESEEALDYRGLTKEWFSLLTKEIFNPKNGLFKYSAPDNYRLVIDPESVKRYDSHLALYRFYGRIAGLAVFHRQILVASLSPVFFKLLLFERIEMEDLIDVDKDLYATLLWIHNNDPTELGWMFAIDEPYDNGITHLELKTGGNKILLTEENKEEYIRLVLYWKFVARVQYQMSAFNRGFTEFVPLDAIKKFNYIELEMLMCGVPEIDIEDWKKNTVYQGGYTADHKSVQLFWNYVTSLNNEMRGKVLFFVTGTSRVPAGGFKQLSHYQFTIQKVGTADQLPEAHTCYNRLDLPPYENIEQIKKKFLQAILCDSLNLI